MLLSKKGEEGKKEKKLAQMRKNCGCSNERGKLRCYGMRLEMGGRISSLWVFVWVCVFTEEQWNLLDF